jgi:DNA polymerase-3 subunit gamma/tau
MSPPAPIVLRVTTALYRRYRPETFADVIGQEHVTEPLMAAISGHRTSHAYLFSGPRGCGKTTSARILARCLNCEKGPTPVPCGTCPSCVELARGGPGSLDVVEIDAASHNGVDDARELRERAAFAPARDRYKIFILDEAHMVTTQGFNALLKLVEEPPPHVTFVFATTEPEKVISTIRSRTHHYPFRLVPPDRLQAYLEQICAAEGVSVGAGVLPLVVRAGGGSVRDSLSVLDQLIAGAEGEVDYAHAVALLGYTPATLLDDAVEAVEAADGSSVFRVVDRVVESGHDPRRFVEDLLQRLRDLIVVVAAGERAADVLRGVPEDQFARMTVQAERLGLGQLSRAADLTMAALGEMTGATSPRLQLELLCARLLLPAADEPTRGYGARLERLEREVRALASAPPSAPGTAPVAVDTPVPVNWAAAPIVEPALPEAAPAASGASTTHPPAPSGSGMGAPLGATRPDEERTGGAESSAPGQPPERVERPDVAAASATTPQPPPGLDTETVRRRWPEVLETLSRIRRASWTITSQNAQVVDLSGTTLRLRFDTSGIATAFRQGQHAGAVERALRETLGLEVRIEAEAGEAAAAGGRRPRTPSDADADTWAGPSDVPPPQRAMGSAGRGRARAAGASTATAGSSSPPASPKPRESAAERDEGRAEQRLSPGEAAPGKGSEGHRRGRPANAPLVPADPHPEDDDVVGELPPGKSDTRLPTGRVGSASFPPPAIDWSAHVEEPDPDDVSPGAPPLVGAPLVQRVFGATIIDEIPVDPTGAAPPAGPPKGT